MFISAQPQYIMPDGGTGTSGKGKFEFALGHIGWAVGGGFAVGSLRGGLGELMNPETRKLVKLKLFLLCKSSFLRSSASSMLVSLCKITLFR